MRKMIPSTASEAVVGGAQFLDEKLPGWWTVINMETLNLASTRDCVLGQLQPYLGLKAKFYRLICPGRFAAAGHALGMRWAVEACNLGFDSGWEYSFRLDELQDEWRQVIAARRAMARMPKPVEGIQTWQTVQLVESR